MADSNAPFGVIKYMALNANKEMIAFYTEADTKGRIIVLKSDFTMEHNRLDTRLVDAKQLVWCGNDAITLTFDSNIMMVGPKEFEQINFGGSIAGVFCATEIDGMRIATSHKTYFLERVQDAVVHTFKPASLFHAAQLLKAQKSVDNAEPGADEVIRGLGK